MNCLSSFRRFDWWIKRTWYSFAFFFLMIRCHVCNVGLNCSHGMTREEVTMFTPAWGHCLTQYIWIHDSVSSNTSPTYLSVFHMTSHNGGSYVAEKKHYVCYVCCCYCCWRADLPLRWLRFTLLRQKWQKLIVFWNMTGCNLVDIYQMLCAAIAQSV